MQVELHAVNRQCSITWLHYNPSLYPHLLTPIVYMPYSYNNWTLKELKDELEKEINSMRTHKECDYVTGQSCISAPSGDCASSPFFWISKSQYLLSF